MKTLASLTRRGFVASAVAVAVPALRAEGGWTELFDGHSLAGWRASENTASWKVREGALAADGPRSHLFYSGPFHNARFTNFELEADCLSRLGCNSGVYFHTEFQDSRFPRKGFEVQVDNTYVGDGGYRERKKTGSLYGVRNLYKAFVRDDEWYKIRVLVRGQSAQVRLNDLLVVDYVSPEPFSGGTFALQCHNDGSRASFRSIRVRPLADDLPTPGAIPQPDDVFRAIVNYGRQNIPMVDYHVHLKGGSPFSRPSKNRIAMESCTALRSMPG